MDYLKIKKYYIKVKDFLLGNTNREFLTFMFFLLISSAFWLLQALNETYEVELRIPLKSINVPNDIVVTADLPENLQVMVRDKGTVLVRYLYGTEMTQLDIDCKEYDNEMPSGRVLLDMGNVQKSVQARLLASTQIISILPDTLEYFYNRGATKRIPVKHIGEITTEPEYYIKDVSFSPDSVDFLAPTSILDTVTAAYVMTSGLKDLSETYSTTENLRKVRGGRFIPSKVEMNVDVDMFTEKTVEVPIVGRNFPKNNNLRTFPSKAKIVFRIGMSHFKEVSANDFSIYIDYNEVLDSRAKKLKLKLHSYPQGISNVKIIPEEVDYLLEQLQDEEEQ